MCETVLSSNLTLKVVKNLSWLKLGAFGKNQVNNEDDDC